MSTFCSSSSGSSRGISSGSFCRSASMVAMTSPRAASKPGFERRRLPAVARHADDAQPRVLLHALGQQFGSVVGAAVVDDQHLETAD
jgi:hypothetical protein